MSQMTVSQCSAGSLDEAITTSTNQFTGFAYDSSGNETGGIGTQTYDAENRMTMSGYPGFTLTNAFDALNLKITKTRSDGLYPKMYWRDIWGNTLSESDTSGHMLNDYIYFAGKRIAYVTSSGSQYYYLTDHLGSVRKIADQNGVVCYDADYTPYGDAVILMNTCAAQPYLFAGMERDEDQLDYDFARFYSWRQGRFMSADPLGGSVLNPQSLNRYAYVVNNPINNTDPSGMLCKKGYSCYGDGWNDPGGGGGGSAPGGGTPWGGDPNDGLGFYGGAYGGGCTVDGLSGGCGGDLFGLEGDDGAVAGCPGMSACAPGMVYNSNGFGSWQYVSTPTIYASCGNSSPGGPIACSGPSTTDLGGWQFVPTPNDFSYASAVFTQVFNNTSGLESGKTEVEFLGGSAVAAVGPEFGALVGATEEGTAELIDWLFFSYAGAQFMTDFSEGLSPIPGPLTLGGAMGNCISGDCSDLWNMFTGNGNPNP